LAHILIGKTEFAKSAFDFVARSKDHDDFFEAALHVPDPYRRFG